MPREPGRDRALPELSMADRAVTDPRFLVTADPGEVDALLAVVTDPEARLAAAVYRASAGAHRGADAETRRQLLALDAARLGADRLLRGFAALNGAAVTDGSAVEWQVVWATGSAVHPGRLRTRIDSDSDVDVDVDFAFGTEPIGPAMPAPAVTTVVDGRQVTLRCDRGTGLRVVDEYGYELPHQPERLPGFDPDDVLACVVDARPHVVAGDGARLVLWDLTTGHLRREILPFGDDDYLNCWTSFELNGEPHLLAAGLEGTLALIDLPFGQIRDTGRSSHGDLRLLLPTSVDARLHVLVSGCDPHHGEPVDRAELWDLEPLRQVDHLLIDTSIITPVTIGPRELLHTGFGELWDLSDPPPTRRLPGHLDTVRALALVELAGRSVLISADDRSLLLRDLATGALLGDPISTVPTPDKWRQQITHLTTTTKNGRPLAVTEHVNDYGDTMTRAWDLGTSSELPSTIEHATPAPTTGTVADPPVVVEATAREVRVLTATPDRDILSRLTFPDRVTAVTLTPTGDLVVAFGPDTARFEPVVRRGSR